MSQSTTPSFKLSLRPLALCISLALTACGGAEMSSSSSTAAQPEAISGNSISGIGMPNPNPVVTRNWGDLPAGRNWGSTAGIDIDPTDGNVVAYERCGAGNFGSGVPVNCEDRKSVV